MNKPAENSDCGDDTEPEENPSADRSEVRRIIIWMAALIGLSTIPYLIGYACSTDEWKFTGHLLPVPGDTSFHMSWSRQAYEGRVLFASQHNGAEAKTRLIFNLLFLVIGWTGRVFGLPLEIGWQIVRIVIAILLFLVIYQFTSFFIRDRKWKWFALIWITTSAGFGWLEMAGLPNWWTGPGADYVATAPIDTSVAEGSTYWYMQWEVVTTPTVVLLVASLCYPLLYFETARRRYLVLSALSAFLMGLVHPHNLMTIYGTLFLYVSVPAVIRRLSLARRAVSWNQWKLLFVVVAASAPTLAYYAWVLRQEPVLWNYVDAQYFFGPLQLLTGYGLPGIAAIVGTIVICIKRESRYAILPAWVACGLAVLYTPIPPAGRVHGIDGLHIAVCILGTRGLMQIFAWLSSTKKAHEDPAAQPENSALARFSLITIIVVSALTNILRMANEFVITSRQDRPPFMTRLMGIGLTGHIEGLGMAYDSASGAPYFLPGDLRRAYDWLNENTSLTDVVLAPPYVSTFVPYLAGNRVFYGHGYVTPKMWERQEQVERFFSFTQPQAVRNAFLRTRQIDYVIFWSGDPSDDNDTGTQRFVTSLEESHPLKLVYQNPRALIFETTFSGARQTSSDAADHSPKPQVDRKDNPAISSPSVKENP